MSPGVGFLLIALSAAVALGLLLGLTVWSAGR